MKYPSLLEKINSFLGILCGYTLMVIASLSCFEVIMRAVFNNPTSWSSDISRYLLIWLVFLGSAYSFQEKGHVCMDFVRQSLAKKFGGRMERNMAIIGYLLSTVFVVVLIISSISMIKDALKLNRLTQALIQIPIVYLYAAILIGSVLMLITVFFIILDLIQGGEKYLRQ